MIADIGFMAVEKVRRNNRVIYDITDKPPARLSGNKRQSSKNSIRIGIRSAVSAVILLIRFPDLIIKDWVLYSYSPFDCVSFASAIQCC